MDIVRIKNLKIPGRHGAYEFEKEKEGIFELDIEMFLDLKKPAEIENNVSRNINLGA